MADVEGIRVVIDGDDSGLTAAGRRAQRSVRDLDTVTATSSLRMARNVLRMSKVFIAAMSAIGYATSRALQAAAPMNNLASSIGLTTQQLSELEQVARSAAVPVEGLKGAFQSLIQKMSERSVGDAATDTQLLFGTLGIAAKDSAGRVRELMPVLLEVADKFSRMKDSPEKAAIAMRLFGDQGVALIPMLNKGAAGLREMMGQAREFGTSIDENASRSAQEFMGRLGELNGMFQAVMRQVGAALLPALTNVSEYFKNVIKDSATTSKFVDTVAFSFKVLASALVITAGTVYATGQSFLFLAKGIKAVWDMVFNRSAMEESLKAAQEQFESVGETLRGMRDITTSIWTAPIEQSKVAAVELPKANAPIIASAAEVARNLEILRTQYRYTFEDMMSMETTPFEEKLSRLNDMVRSGAISWREYLAAVKDVNNGQKQAMDDLLSSASGALTSIFENSKAAAIASALINTYQGVTKAIAQYPPPYSYAMAGIQLAMGMAQVAKIRSTSKTSTSGGGGTVSSAAAAAPQAAPTTGRQSTGTLFVQGIDPRSLFTGDAVRDIAGKLLAFQRDGGRVVLGSR